MWFNPPSSLNVKTNIGKVFLKFVRRHFSRSHKFSKIFKLNTIKISYSSMPNVKNLIKRHNSKILSKEQDKTQRSCNCTIKESCPFNGKCLHLCKVYMAEVTTITTYKKYYGTSEKKFKCRCDNQMQSFRHISHDKELSKYLWILKTNEDPLLYIMEFKIVPIPIQIWHKKVWFVSDENIVIFLADPKVRKELISKCRYRNKFILNSVKKNPFELTW